MVWFAVKRVQCSGAIRIDRPLLAFPEVISVNSSIHSATDPSRSSYYIDDAFYTKLIQQLSDWHQEGIPVNSEVRSSCEALLFREARLLDDGQFTAWLDLFVPECLYWIPSVPGGGDPRRQVSIAFDDRRRLEDRVFWLQCGFAYSQTPRSRTSRIIGNIEAVQGATATEIRVRSNFVIHEFRQGKLRSIAGWYGHQLHQQDGNWKIVLKQINLIDCDQGQDNLTFLL